MRGRGGWGGREGPVVVAGPGTCLSEQGCEHVGAPGRPWGSHVLLMGQVWVPTVCSFLACWKAPSAWALHPMV